MKQNTFSVIVLSFLVSFALIFSGGCGGSSSSSLTETQSSSSNVQSYVAASEMVSIMQTEKFAKMFNELGEQGVFERIGDWYLMYNVSEDIQAKILGQLSGEERESMVRSFYSADLVAEKYNSGEVVAIAYPDEAIINKVLEAAGLETGDRMHESDKNGKLEVYAIAKRIAGGREVLSAYTVPCSVNFDAPVAVNEDPGPVSSDEDAETLSEDMYYNGTDSDDKQEITPEIMTNEDFQVDRWRRFFLWCAELDYDSVEASAYADRIDVKAAENYIRSIAQAQRETLDLSYCYDNGRRQNWFSNWQGIFEIIYNRTSTLNYTISSAHSVNDGYDYYFIRSDVTTKPNSFIDEINTITGTDYLLRTFDMPFNWLSGWTSSVEIMNYIFYTDGETGGNFTPLYVDIVASLPELSRTSLENGVHTMSYSVPGGEMSYFDSMSWNPPISRNHNNYDSVDYFMIAAHRMDDAPYSNRSSSIGWRVGHGDPFWSSMDWYISIAVYWRKNLRARPAQQNEFSYHNAWIYRIDPSSRHSYRTLYLSIDTNFEEGVARGALSRWAAEDFDSYYNTKTISRSRWFMLRQPPLN